MSTPFSITDLHFAEVKSSISPARYLARLVLSRSLKVAAICGPSGSGKTTLANQLHEALGSDKSLLLQVDSYWRYTRPQMAKLKLTGYDWQGRDRQRFLRDLKLLIANQPIDRPVYEYQRETPTTQTVRVAPKPFVILEDTLDFSGLADLIVFTYAPDEMLISRRIERDKGKTSFRTAQELETYLRTKSLPAYHQKLLPVAQKAGFILDTSTNKLLTRA